MSISEPWLLRFGRFVASAPFGIDWNLGYWLIIALFDRGVLELYSLSLPISWLYLKWSFITILFDKFGYELFYDLCALPARSPVIPESYPIPSPADPSIKV